MERRGEEWHSAERVASYQALAELVPRLAEGDSVLLELLPARLSRVLDIGTGDGRLIALIREERGGVEAVGIDFSPPMLAAARERFDGVAWIVEHDLTDPLPDMGGFDAIVSSLVIHHQPDERKRSLYRELFELLEPGGVFLNLEHVASATQALHAEFLGLIDEEDDHSDQLAPVEAQLEWLREAGFADVDCMWKWRELALLHGRKAT